VGETRDLAVRDAPEAVFCDSCCHVPVFAVDYEIGVLIAELVEIVVGLFEKISIDV
jgi:hypothetical protein